MKRTLFTPNRAREVLHRIRPVAERVCRVYRQMETRKPESVMPDEPVDRGYFRLLRELHAMVNRIADEGVVVKDPARGLIDFPARRSGRAVWLCWQVGEPALAWWHEQDAGFAGRQPIDEDGPWEGSAEEAEVAG